jgi:hypothetical protein
VQINRAYCIDNPERFQGCGEDCWGPTACDIPKCYSAHRPGNDNGTIAPTAALASMFYTPEDSIWALRFYDGRLGDRLWADYGFSDVLNLTENWFAKSHLAIDQGPIVVMIENYRSGLLWRLFMSCPEVKEGLRKLGFESPHLR